LVQTFGDQPFTMAVQGLFGCTTVVVVSRRGVWMSHFWEVPSFLSWERFQQDIIHYMWYGDDTPEMPGIYQYTNPGKLFSLENHPATLIITPRSRTCRTPGDYEFRPMVEEIRHSLKILIPTVEPIVVDYETSIEAATWQESAIASSHSSTSKSMPSSPSISSPSSTSTSSPPPPPSSTKPPPPYATSRCNIHVGQVGESDVYIDVNITDAKGAVIGSGHGGIAWGATLSINSKLVDAMKVTPEKGISNKQIKRAAHPLPATGVQGGTPSHLLWKRAVGPPPPRPLYQKGPVKFAVRAQSWDTASSACSVGGWDNGNAKDFLGTLIFGDIFLSVRP